MNRSIKIAALSLALLCIASPTLAQPAAAPPEPQQVEQPEKDKGVSSPEVSDWHFMFHSGTFGVALVIAGAAYGISKIGYGAVESMARQPEVAGAIQTAMFISAALIEGATFFALVVCWFAYGG